MTYEWGDLISLEYGKPVSDKKSTDGKIPVFGTNGQIGTSHLSPLCPKPSFVVGRKGAYRGVHYSKVPFSVIDTAFYVKNLNENVLDTKWAYYKFLTYDINSMDSGSAIPSTDRYEIYKIEVDLPDIKVQRKVVGILSSLDDKIEVNNKIIKNLEEQLCLLYKSFILYKEHFIGIKPVSELFTISIGKTPPRKETEWFSKKETDIKWVSISDMGKSYPYIQNTSEYITKEAAEKFNIKVVPDNTILLSFKLTLGRICITDGEMATNEAIAHFPIEDESILEYLYCYLRTFNYETLGNTSSIATAVNSKIIKNMQIPVPKNDELDRFHHLTAPLLQQIKILSRQQSELQNIREALLTKLISGEIELKNK